MPFWKPDGRAIGFYANDGLKIVSVDGGVPQVLAQAPQGIGGSWNSDGTIIFTPAQNTGLFKIPESGGVAVPLNVPDAAKQELFFEWPHFLPDGRHYLYLARSENSTEQQLPRRIARLPRNEADRECGFKSFVNCRLSVLRKRHGTLCSAIRSGPACHQRRSRAGSEWSRLGWRRQPTEPGILCLVSRGIGLYIPGFRSCFPVDLVRAFRRAIGIRR